MILQQAKLLKKVVTIFSILALIGTAIPAIPGAAAYSFDTAGIIMPTPGEIIKGYSLGHYALDIGNQYGSPVTAAISGKIVKMLSSCGKLSPACGGGYGNHILIDHGNGLNTLYSHLGQTTVKIGDKISQGQLIGRIGRSGNLNINTPTHLHFEIRLNGKKENPLNYI
jgi:murein DD-endopeptidase MepM/ murein hydrolase activator NlpD